MKKIDYSYSSPLASLMKDYENYYTKQNKRLKNITLQLRTLDQYLLSINYKYGDPLTEEIYYGCLSNWDGRHQITIYHAALTFIRIFKYFVSRGIKCDIPRPPRDGKSSFIPYIFSEEDIHYLFEYCDKYRDRNYLKQSHAFVMPSMLRTLFSTSIRVQEATSLKNKDVNINKHYIIIKGPKNGKDRLAPINASLEQVLQEYVNHRNLLGIEGVKSPNSPFFVTVEGKECNPSTITTRFHQIIDLMKKDLKKDFIGVRLHDLRHTACVHALMKMVRSGKDPYCCLPILSVFMGHKSPSSTEYYLRLTEEMYPEIIKLDLSYTNSIRDIIEKGIYYTDDEKEV